MSTTDLVKETEVETGAMSNNILALARALGTEIRALREEVKMLSEANMVLRKRIGETRVGVEEVVSIVEKEAPFITTYDNEEGGHSSIIDNIRKSDVQYAAIPRKESTVRSRDIAKTAGPFS